MRFRITLVDLASFMFFYTSVFHACFVFSFNDSEFGVSSFFSFESMSGAISPPYWTAHNDVMYQRNYAADSIINTYFGVAPYINTKPSAGRSTECKICAGA
jgi:hypothetical protein